MTTQQLYQKVLNEQMTRSEFLWHVRRNPEYQDMITNTMSFEDTVSKLKGKGHLSTNNNSGGMSKGFNFFSAFKALNESLTEGKKQKIKGGKGDKLTADDVNYYEFTKGWKHELEHTDDIDKAKEIAIDHLAEDPNYYTRLEMIEYKAKKKNRTDLPIEIKKGQLKDKDNEMKVAPKKKAPKKDK
jgi:hypothetical protein